MARRSPRVVEHPREAAVRPGWPETLVLVSALAALAVVPVVVRLRVVPLSGEVYALWNGQRVNYDFFSYYKARLLVGLAAVALLGLAGGLAQGRSLMRCLPVPVAVMLACYVALAAASAWASTFPAVVLDGFPDRYEGLAVLVAYGVVVLASFGAFHSVTRAESAARGLALSAAVIGLVGAFQYVGLDLFQSSVGRSLILPSSQAFLASGQQLHQVTSKVYSTLYHYDYVGSYTALVLPFVLALFVSEPVPAGLKKLSGMATAPLAVVWALCGARSGWVGAGIAILVLVVVQRRRLRAIGWVPALVACGGLVAVVSADTVFGGRIQTRAAALVSDVANLVHGAAGAAPALPLRLVALEGATIRLATPTGTIDVRNDDGDLTVINEEKRQLRLLVDAQSGRFRIDEPGFEALKGRLGRIGGKPALEMSAEGYVLNFLFLESDIRLAMKTGKVVSTEAVDAMGFAGLEALGSGRGFIWSRSLPLLRQALFVGFGPDTFALVFPQHDFTGKFLVYGTTDMLVDKPHNLWLQVALNTGVLSALALALLAGWYVAASAGIYLRQRPQDMVHAVGSACFVGVVGYLVASLFNDSVVSVAPVFWAMLGLGIRMNVLAATG